MKIDAALKDFSRCTPVPIRAATPQSGQIQVSAVLRAGDMDALRATLLDNVKSLEGTQIGLNLLMVRCCCVTITLYIG